jgi:hypothetical protein
VRHDVGQIASMRELGAYDDPLREVDWLSARAPEPIRRRLDELKSMCIGFGIVSGLRESDLAEDTPAVVDFPV